MTGTLIFACSLAAAWGPQEGWPDSLHVNALPHLNVRHAASGQIAYQLPDGTAIASHRLAHTARLDTINGLSGEWLTLDDTLTVFDAYLWVADPPRVEELEHGSYVELEAMQSYGARVVDGLHVARFYSLYEDYGGPSGEAFGLEVHCTPGQALQCFRRFLRAQFIHEGRLEEQPELAAHLASLLGDPWDGAEPLAFSWGGEGGGFSWVLKLVDADRGVYGIEFSMGSC